MSNGCHSELVIMDAGARLTSIWENGAEGAARRGAGLAAATAAAAGSRCIECGVGLPFDEGAIACFDGAQRSC
jgi:hypothetical protein